MYHSFGLATRFPRIGVLKSSSRMRVLSLPVARSAPCHRGSSVRDSAVHVRRVKTACPVLRRFPPHFSPLYFASFPLSRSL